MCYTTLLNDEQSARVPHTTIRNAKGEMIARFAESPRGVLPQILEKLWAGRQATRKRMATETDGFVYKLLNAKQLAQKASFCFAFCFHFIFLCKQFALVQVGMNSLYGFTGAVHGMLPCTRIASAVTAEGRNMLQRSKEHVEANYKCKVVYGDSVTGDTRVLVWESRPDAAEAVNQEGSVCTEEPTGPRAVLGREVTVAELFAEYDHDDGVDRPPLMVQTHRGYAALKAVMCHRTTKPVYRVTVSDGRHVDVTEDHSIAVVVDGNMQFARPIDLLIGASVIATQPVS
jgi:hypothetical protein